MGNLTNDGQTYKFEYDAFGRLRKIRDQSNNLVEEFRYNGLNHRIAWLYDADNDVDGSDPWFYFVYDRSWRMVASYRGSDAEAKELFVNHQAGLNGTQTSLPLDAFVLRDRNTAGYWADSVSSFSGERTYHCQNYFGGRGDVVAILTSTGKQMEQVRYSAYGVPFGIPAGDTNADGGVVATPDIAQITAWTSGAYNVRGDFDLDGDVDNDDVNIVSSNFGKSVGWGKLSVGPNDTLTGFVGGFRKGYCGYEHDGTNPKIMHVRHRAYLADLGRWTRRDPLGYVDGGNLYGYVTGRTFQTSDPLGLMIVTNPGNGLPSSTLPDATPQVHPVCPSGMYWDSTTSQCRPWICPIPPRPDDCSCCDMCGPWTRHDPSTSNMMTVRTDGTSCVCIWETQQEWTRSCNGYRCPEIYASQCLRRTTTVNVYDCHAPAEVTPGESCQSRCSRATVPCPGNQWPAAPDCGLEFNCLPPGMEGGPPPASLYDWFIEPMIEDLFQ